MLTFLIALLLSVNPAFADSIALYSGSFDPPTLAHRGLIVKVDRSFKIDRFIILVNNTSDVKKFKASTADRIAMMQLLFKDYAGRIEINPIDQNDKNAFSEKLLSRGKDQIYRVIGQDSFEKLPAGVYSPGSKFHWVVAERKDQGQGPLHPGPNLSVLKEDEHGISSTLLRQQLKTNCVDQRLIDSKVLEYIKTKNLYSVLPSTHLESHCR